MGGGGDSSKQDRVRLAQIISKAGGVTGRQQETFE